MEITEKPTDIEEDLIKELEEKEAELKEIKIKMEVLQVRARPRSLGFYRSRFNA